jgi:hypothetical protein
MASRETQANVRPTILVATTNRWFPTARLAMALAKVGCIVDMVCPTSHPVQKTSVVRRIHRYRGLTPLGSFWKAIEFSRPDLIVPGDDLATWHLHELWEESKRQRQTGAWVCELIARSLGAPESFPVVQSRLSFMRMAEEEGVRAPRTELVNSAEDLRRWSASAGFPIVLKANGTSGGDGVGVTRTMNEAERALRKLQAPPLIARALKRAIVDLDNTLVKPSLARRKSLVNAQAFVNGHEATSTVACWGGTVLASLHFEVLQKRHASGPATVLRRIEHPEMSAACETMVRRLNLSGFHGFDFMLEEGTEHAYLIEINPRSTQVGHLALGADHDLPAALFAALSGEDAVRCKVTENDTIALFPHEWVRDPASSFLQTAHHDIPWDEPELVTACIRTVEKHTRQHLAETLKRVEDRLNKPVRNPSSSVDSNPWIPEQDKSRYE